MTTRLAMKVKSIVTMMVAVAVAMMAFGTVGAGEAQAGDRHRGHRGGMNVQFDYLSVSTYRDRVVVEYEIDRGDWRAVQRAGIRPTLELYTPNGRSHRYSREGDVCLEGNRGTVTFYDVRLGRHAENVEIRLSGANRRAYIATVSYGRSRGAGAGLLVGLESYDQGYGYGGDDCDRCGDRERGHRYGHWHDWDDDDWDDDDWDDDDYYEDRRRGSTTYTRRETTRRSTRTVDRRSSRSGSSTVVSGSVNVSLRF